MTKYNEKATGSVIKNLVSKNLKEQANNRKCYYKECEFNPIDSHSIPKSVLEATIGKSGYVYNKTLLSVARDISQGECPIFDKLPITQAGVFKGFCGDKNSNSSSHDTNLFKKIEINVEIQKTSVEHYIFLYAYRFLVYQLDVDRTLGESIRESNESLFKQNQVTSKNAEIISQGLKKLEVPNIDCLMTMKTNFEEHINSTGVIDKDIKEYFNIYDYDLQDYEVDFAGGGIVNFPSKYPVIVGVIPAYSNKSDLFFIVTHIDDRSIIECIQNSMSCSNPQHVIDNLVAMTGNLMLSELLYNKLKSDESLEKLEDLIKKGTKNFIGRNGFDLLRRKNGDEVTT